MANIPESTQEKTFLLLYYCVEGIIRSIDFTKDIPCNVSQVRTRLTTKNIRHCFENHKGYHFRSFQNGDEGECKTLQKIKE